MLDHPLSRGTQTMVGEICSAHSQLGNPGIELDRSDDFQSSLCDVGLDQMGGHVPPAETSQQHRLLRAEVRYAPSAPGQDDISPLSRHSGLPISLNSPQPCSGVK